MKNPVKKLNVLATLWLASVAWIHAEVLPLAGEWEFAMDRKDEGVAGEWYGRELHDRIKLPGVLQAQGYGDEISVDTPWVVGLGDAWWKLQPEDLRAEFSQPGKVEVPFLSQPTRHYLGVAWYAREVEVPEAWAGKRVSLFLERARWGSTVWVDGKECGSARSLVAPHEFDLGVLRPGKHRITVRLDNRMVVSDPNGNNGHMPDAHAVSDALGQTWNGIVGKIELRATPVVWIKDVQVFPDVENKGLKVKVEIGNDSGAAGEGELVLDGIPVNAMWMPEGGVAEVGKLFIDEVDEWDEFDPNVQKLKVELKSEYGTDEKAVNYGMRSISWRGKDPLINGKVANFRMTHFGLDFPLTGYPATDVETWREIIKRCQEFGLNGIRFHSCCPPEAAFEAADELGFYLQAECGLWAPFYQGGVFTKYLEEETELLLRAYGNHPSFVFFSPSNEPSGRYTEVTPKWASEWYAKDPRHLYAVSTGWNRPEQVEGGAQFAVLVRYGKGELRNETGWFGNDFRKALEGVEIPVMAHEIGQWCAYPDFKVIESFTGFLRPSNYDIFRRIAERNGLLERNAEFAHASGRFQLACYKEELEANLRTPGLAGHQMLDIRDYLGQGTALIGVLDAFWQPKGYVTGEEFRRFHSETVPLARLKKRIFTSNETLKAEVELYHFGTQPIKNALPYWKVLSETGEVLADGEFAACNVPIGKNHPLGSVALSFDKFPKAAMCKLVVGLEGTSIENDWKFWVYPAINDVPVPDDVLETSDWAKAAKALEAGGKVLFTPSQKQLDAGQCPPMRRVPVFWNIQMTVRPPNNPAPRFDAMLGLWCDAKSPALAEFPTEEHCDWQWTSIIHSVRSVNLSTAPRELRPIVSAIDDWNRSWRLGVIFECKVGNGKLLVCAIPLSENAKSPVARQLRKSLLDYAASDKFSPTSEVGAELLGSLWNGGTGAKPAERKFDPDLDDGTGR